MTIRNGLCALIFLFVLSVGVFALPPSFSGLSTIGVLPGEIQSVTPQSVSSAAGDPLNVYCCVDGDDSCSPIPQNSLCSPADPFASPYSAMTCTFASTITEGGTYYARCALGNNATDELSAVQSTPFRVNVTEPCERTETTNTFCGPGSERTVEISGSAVNYYDEETKSFEAVVPVFENITAETKTRLQRDQSNRVKKRADYQTGVLRGRNKLLLKDRPSDAEAVRVEGSDSELSFNIAQLMYRGDSGTQLIANSASRPGRQVNESRFTYKRIFGNGSDLSFDYSDSGVKEELSISSRSFFPRMQTATVGSNPYVVLSHRMNIPTGLDLVVDGFVYAGGLVNASGNILVQQNGNTKFIIPLGEVRDARGQTNDVTYSLRSVNGVTYLDSKVSAAWLQDSARRYPVVIDPSIVFPDASSADANFVLNDLSCPHATSCTANDLNTLVGKISSSDAFCTFLSYYIGGIPNNATITDTRLSLYPVEVLGSGTYTTSVRAQSSAPLTYLPAFSRCSTGLVLGSVTTDFSVNAYHDGIDLGPDADDLVSSANISEDIVQLGVALDNNGGGNRLVRFGAKESGQGALLTVTYTTPAGVPAAPTNLTVRPDLYYPLNTQAGRLILNWSDNAVGETDYNVYRGTGSALTNYARIAANSTTYADGTVTSLSDNNTFWYNVRANLNGSGSSLPSPTVAATTADRNGPTFSSGLAGSNVLGASAVLNLSWNAASDEGGPAWSPSSLMPIHYYSLDGAYDDDGNAFNDALVSSGHGVAPPFVKGVFGRAASFSGDVYGDANCNVLDVNLRQGEDRYPAISAELWFKTDAFAPGPFFDVSSLLSASNNAAIFPGHPESQVEISAVSSSGHLLTSLKGSDSDGNYAVLGYAQDLADGNWHHVVLTWNGTTARLYVDGIDRNNMAYLLSDQGPIDVREVMGIGGRTCRNWYGQIPSSANVDEVSIYNKAMDPYEVERRYRMGVLSLKYGLERAGVNDWNMQPVNGQWDRFDGTTFSPNYTSFDTSTGTITQGSRVQIVGSNAWGATGFTSKRAFDRNTGVIYEGDVNIGSITQTMVGFKDSGSGTSYTAGVHNLFFNNGLATIYEDGTFRAQVGTITANRAYHFKIVLKPEGALYYLDENLLYDSNYSMENNLKPYVTHYLNVVASYDNFKITVPTTRLAISDGNAVDLNGPAAPAISNISVNSPSSLTVSWTNPTLIADQNTSNQYVITGYDSLGNWSDGFVNGHFEGGSGSTASTWPVDTDCTPYSESCPYLYSWTGQSFELDNDLYPGAFNAVDDSRSNWSRGISEEYTDYYRLETNAVEKDGQYLFEVREIPGEESFTDHVTLTTIDHSPDVNVASDNNGNVFTFSDPNQPSTCVLNGSINCLPLIDTVGDANFIGAKGDLMEFNFGILTDEQKKNAKFLLRSDACSLYLELDVVGTWEGVERVRPTKYEINPHEYWGLNVYDLNEFLIGLEGPLKLRLRWTSGHKIDYVALDTTPQQPVMTKKYLAKRVEKNGSNVTSLLSDSDNQYVHLVANEKFSLSFPAEPVACTGCVRNFMISSEGYYVPTKVLDLNTFPGSAVYLANDVTNTVVAFFLNDSSAVQKDLPEEYVEIRALPLSGKLKLASRIDGMAYIDSISLRIVNPLTGNERVLNVLKNPALLAADGHYFPLGDGRDVWLDFGGLPFDIQNQRVYVTFKGYRSTMTASNVVRFAGGGGNGSYSCFYRQISAPFTGYSFYANILAEAGQNAATEVVLSQSVPLMIPANQHFLFKFDYFCSTAAASPSTQWKFSFDAPNFALPVLSTTAVFDINGSAVSKTLSSFTCAANERGTVYAVIDRNATTAASVTFNLSNASSSTPGQEIILDNLSIKPAVDINFLTGTKAVFLRRRDAGTLTGPFTTTSSTITGLSVNTRYDFNLMAMDRRDNNSALGARLTRFTATNLPAPPIVTSNDANSLTIVIDQNGNPDVNTYYSVYSPTTDQCVCETDSGTVLYDYPTCSEIYSCLRASYSSFGGASGITFGGLVPGTQYDFQVDSMNGDFSHYNSYGGTTSVVVQSATPANFQVDYNQSRALNSHLGGINLRWDDVNGESGYNIYRSTNNFANTSLIATVAANTTSYLDNAVTDNNTLWYGLEAIVNGTTYESVTDANITLDRSAPLLPASFAAAGLTNQVSLSWTPSDDNANYASLLDENARFYLRFEELGATNYSSVPNGSLFKSGTFTGGRRYVQGPLGRAIDLNGSNYLATDFNLATLTQTNRWTISIWMKNNNPADGNGWLVGQAAGNLFNFGKQAGANALYVNMAGLGAKKDLALGVFDGNWHHIVLTRNGSVWSIFVDGLDVNSFSSAATLTAGGNAHIGRDASSNGYFRGQLDDLLVYDRDVSYLDVNYLYHLGTVKYGLQRSEGGIVEQPIGGLFDNFGSIDLNSHWTITLGHANHSYNLNNDQLTLIKSNGQAWVGPYAVSDLNILLPFALSYDFNSDSSSTEVADVIFDNTASSAHAAGDFDFFAAGTDFKIFTQYGNAWALRTQGGSFTPGQQYNVRIFHYNTFIRVLVNDGNNWDVTVPVDPMAPDFGGRLVMHGANSATTGIVSYDNVLIQPLIDGRNYADENAVDSSNPSDPTDFTISATSATSLDANWTDSTDAGNDYNYGIRSFDGFGNNSAYSYYAVTVTSGLGNYWLQDLNTATTYRPTAASYALTDLTPGTTHCLTVKATDARDNNSALSEMVCETLVTTAVTLSSFTHPVENTWYDSTSASFETSGTFSGILYVIDQNISLNAAQIQARGTFDTDGSFSTVIPSNGQWYAHVLALSDSNTGTQTDDFNIFVDNAAPTGLTLTLSTITTNYVLATTSGAVDADSGLNETPYLFDEIVTATTSGYQASTDWNKSGLTPNTLYAFRAKVKDSFGNESAYTADQNRYTLAATPVAPTVSVLTDTTVTLTINANSNPSNTFFAVYDQNLARFVMPSGDVNSVTEIWRIKSDWDATTIRGLAASSSHCLVVKARNDENVDTNNSSMACFRTATTVTDINLVTRDGYYRNQSLWYKTPTVLLRTTGTFHHVYYLLTTIASQEDSNIIANGTYDRDGRFDLNIPSSGTWYVHAVAQNDYNLANHTASVYRLQYDAVAPVAGSVNISSWTGGVEGYTKDTTPPLSISATDAGGSSLRYVQFSCNNTTWTTRSYATSMDFSIASGSCPSTDGSRTLYARFVDYAGNISSVVNTGAFVLDRVRPTLSVYAFDASNWTGGVEGYSYNAVPLINLESSDTNFMQFSCDDVTYTDNESFASTKSDFNIQSGAGCVITEGSRRVIGRFRDAAGNLRQLSISYHFDFTPLVLAPYSPANGYRYRYPEPVLIGRTSGSISSVQSCFVRVGTTDPPTTPLVSQSQSFINGYFCNFGGYELEADGTYYWDFNARDRAGNESTYSAAQIIVKDITAPLLPLFYTVENDSNEPYWDSVNNGYTRLQFQLRENKTQCRFSDTNVDFNTMPNSCTVNGYDVDCNLGRKDPTTVAAPYYNVYYSCADDLGNAYDPQLISYGVDFNAPTTTDTVSADPVVLPYDVQITELDNATDVNDLLTYYCTTSLQCTPNELYDHEETIAYDSDGGATTGNRYLRYYSVDLAGNQQATVTKTILVDQLPVWGTIQPFDQNSGTLSSCLAGKSIQFDTNASDPDAGQTLSLFVCSSDSATEDGCAETTYCSSTGSATNPSCVYAQSAADGVQEAFGFIYDSVGLSAVTSKHTTWNCDGVAPSVTLIAPEHSGYVSAAPTFMAQVDEAVLLCELQVATTIDFASPLTGYDDVNMGSDCTYTAPNGLNDGTYYWRVKATDLVDNEGSYTTAQPFTVLSSGPAISLTSIAGDTTAPFWDTVNDNQTAIVVSVDSASTCRASFEDVGYTDMVDSCAGAGSSKTCTVSDLSQALQYGYHVACTVGGVDHNAQTNLDVIFGVDWTAPTVGQTATTALIANDYYAQTPVIITSGMASDNLALNVASCEYTTNGSTWNSGTWDEASSQCADANIVLSDGNNAINYRLQDQAGNVGLGTSLTLIKDVSEPTGYALSFITIREKSLTVGLTGETDVAGLSNTPYWFEDTNSNATSDYQSRSTWDRNDLSPNTLYAFRGRVQDALGNEGEYTPISMAYTLANIPATPALLPIDSNTVQLILDANDNPDITLFAIEDQNNALYVDGNNDGFAADSASASWKTVADWNDGTVLITDLNEESTICLRVKARNNDLTETAFTSLRCATTYAELPVVTITSPANGSTLSSGNTTLAYSATDSSGIAGYYIKIDGNNWIYTSGTTYAVSDLNDGNHTIYVKAVDTLDNNSLDVNVVFAVGSASTPPEEGGSSAVCGNKVVESGEQCDDGGTVSNDGCSSTCRTENNTNTCNQLGGTVCSSTQKCSAGTFVTSSDATLCCLGSCIGAQDMYTYPAFVKGQPFLSGFQAPSNSDQGYTFKLGSNVVGIISSLQQSDNRVERLPADNGQSFIIVNLPPATPIAEATYDASAQNLTRTTDGKFKQLSSRAELEKGASPVQERSQTKIVPATRPNVYELLDSARYGYWNHEEQYQDLDYRMIGALRLISYNLANGGQ